MGIEKGTHSGSLAEMDRVHQDRWLYSQRIRRATYDQIAAMAAAPAIRDENGRYDLGGGLGVQLSRSTVAYRVKLSNKEYVSETDESREELRAYELASLDAQAARIDDLVQKFEPHLDPLSGEWVMRAADWKKRLDAEAMLLRISESRRKLQGTDAPTQVTVEAHVVHEDAAAIELARMLDEQAAETPKKRKKKNKPQVSY